jgi:hypothetical protein
MEPKCRGIRLSVMYGLLRNGPLLINLPERGTTATSESIANSTSTSTKSQKPSLLPVLKRRSKRVLEKQADDEAAQLAKKAKTIDL